MYYVCDRNGSNDNAPPTIRNLSGNNYSVDFEQLVKHFVNLQDVHKQRKIVDRNEAISLRTRLIDSN